MTADHFGRFGDVPNSPPAGVEPENENADEVDEIRKTVKRPKGLLSQIDQPRSSKLEAPAAKRISGFERMKEKVHSKLIDDMPEGILNEFNLDKKRGMLRDRIFEVIEEEAEKLGITLDRAEQDTLAQALIDDMIGFGPIQKLLEDKEITCIMVNGPFHIYYEAADKLIHSDITFRDNDHVMQIIQRFVYPYGKEINISVPYVVSQMPDGSPAHVVIPPLCLNGPSFTIRKIRENLGVHAVSPMVPSRPASSPEGQKNPILETGPIHDLIQSGTLTEAMAIFLEACVKCRLNIVISGGPKSGKSTTLSHLSTLIPDDERIILCENALEFELRKPHVLRLVTCTAKNEGRGAVSLPEVCRIGLNLSPGRLIVGECRGNEVVEILQALNTGQSGLLTTCYADTPADALSRLETMYVTAEAKVPPRLLREKIASAIQVIVHQSRMQDGSRRITHITEIQEMRGEAIILRDIFRFEQAGAGETGAITGTHYSTGVRPAFVSKFDSQGIHLPADLFNATEGKSI